MTTTKPKTTEEKFAHARQRLQEILSAQKGEMVIHHKAKYLLRAAKEESTVKVTPMGRFNRRDWFFASKIADYSISP